MARWHDSMTRLDEGESALVSVPSSLPAAHPPPRPSTPGIILQNSRLPPAWSVRKTQDGIKLRKQQLQTAAAASALKIRNPPLRNQERTLNSLVRFARTLF